MPKLIASLVSGVLILGLSGCFLDGSDDSDDSDSPPQPPALSQQVSDISLTSFDGTPLALTVFQPALAAGQTAPLLLHSHGWGGSRSRDLTGDNLLIDVARRAWESGYFVISFDARGFGESGGQANLQDPAIEGRDVQAIVDWAESNLGLSLAEVNGDPQVGALGVSYAGGMQLSGALVDPRLDALVPAVTWHDLAASLAPNGVPKTLWLTGLYASGAQDGDLAPWLDRLLQASTDGTLEPEQLSRLREQSLASYCSGERVDGLGAPQVDAYFIQGINDTLFNANQAIHNYNCLRQAGNDAYLLVGRGGHLIPQLQAGTLGEFDMEVQCGAQRYRVADLAWTFLDGKLRGQQATLDLPRACFVLNDSQGLVVDSVPVATTAFPLQTTAPVGPPDADALLNLLDAVDEAQFVPLYTADTARPLAGIPRVELQIQSDASPDPRLFMGLGVARAAGTGPELLHDQITPLRGTGVVQSELGAVSTQLQPGDQVGVLLYGFHPQFAGSYTRDASILTINGSLLLPLP